MTNYSIEQVISHRDPMILISGLNHYDDIRACCWVDINEHSPFYNSALNGVPSYVGIEYMAQTVAAYAGANALDHQQTVKIGFLLGARKMTTKVRSFTKGTRLTVNVEELYREESGLSVFGCSISANDEIVAEAKVNVFQPSEPKEFIEEQE
ncbi:MAG: 3-hydroxylacyl-ACP dehydratase [Thalassotalea sp.]